MKCHPKSMIKLDESIIYMPIRIFFIQSVTFLIFSCRQSKIRLEM